MTAGSSISQLRTGLATNLATISGLRTSAFVPDNPTPPIAVIVPNNVNFDSSFGRGMDEYTFKIVVIAARASERSAQNTLDAYCTATGASSIKAAAETDKTLGGKCFDLRVTDVTDYGPLAIGDTQYLAATFNVTVIS